VSRPVRFRDPHWANGVNYNITVQTPQYRMESLDALMHTPITSLNQPVNATTSASTVMTNASIGNAPSQSSLAYGNPGAMTAGNAQLLSNMAGTARGVAPEIVNHYNVQPVLMLRQRRSAGPRQRRLGRAQDHGRRFAEASPGHFHSPPRPGRHHGDFLLPPGSRLDLAILLVYFLMALNFQSWLDPFIILMALPGAMAGVVWMLFVTQTTFSVPSLMARSCVPASPRQTAS